MGGFQVIFHSGLSFISGLVNYIKKINDVFGGETDIGGLNYIDCEKIPKQLMIIFEISQEIFALEGKHYVAKISMKTNCFSGFWGVNFSSFFYKNYNFTKTKMIHLT